MRPLGSYSREWNTKMALWIRQLLSYGGETEVQEHRQQNGRRPSFMGEYLSFLYLLDRYAPTFRIYCTTIIKKQKYYSTPPITIWPENYRQCLYVDGDITWLLGLNKMRNHRLDLNFKSIQVKSSSCTWALPIQYHHGSVFILLLLKNSLFPNPELGSIHSQLFIPPAGISSTY